jgi:dihydrodipicolinate synthase/N-acetylneuraminate lyase
MPDERMRGIFPILVTPFDEKSRIDEDSLRSLVEFNLAAGVHGMGVALGSEIFKLSEAERDLVTRTVVDQVGGRVPVVINTGAAGTDLAVYYSQSAEGSGADALMIIPPAFMPPGPEEVLAYYRAISEAVAIPIFIQDTASAPVPASLACRIAEECPQVRYIKVECAPILEKVAEVIAAASGRLTVFGGAGGTYFLEELQLGSQGTMPFCSQPEAFVEVWNLAQQGRGEAAGQVFESRILPVNRLAEQGAGIFYAVHKEILRRRGVIRTAKVRGPAPAVDEPTRGELGMLIDRLYPSLDQKAD